MTQLDPDTEQGRYIEACVIEKVPIRVSLGREITKTLMKLRIFLKGTGYET